MSQSGSDLAARAEQLRTFVPATPAQMEEQIVEGNNLLEALVDAQKDCNDRRYAAESAYETHFNARIAFWMDNGKNATYARAKAKVEAKDLYEALLNAKAEYHYLEGLSRALQTKIFSLLNINKAVTAAYQSFR